MVCTVSVITSYQFRNSFDFEHVKNMSNFNKGDNKMEKLVSRDVLYCFPLADVLLCMDPEQDGARICVR